MNYFINTMTNSQNKIIYDVEKTCRTCLKNEQMMISILNNYLGNIFKKITHLEISENDGLPSKLCSNCIEKLNNSFTFLNLCITSDSILKQQKVIKTENDEIKTDNIQSSNISDTSITNYLEINYTPKEENTNSAEFKHGTNSVQPDENTENINLIESDEHIFEDIETVENINKPKKKRKKQIKNTSNVQINSSSRLKQKIITDIESLKSEESDFNLYLNCPKCQEEFTKSDRLEAHFRVHLGKKPELCDICNKEFSKLERLQSHMKNHPKCAVCGEMFATKSFLRIHKKTHMGGIKYMCHICGKSFGKNLNVHMALKHCDDKPFPCNVCPLAFKTAAVLKMHLLRHAGTKKYICSTCGFGAVRKWELERHMSRHSDEKRFECKFCPNKYKRQQNLLRHSRVHTGERPYQCDLCSMSFRAKTVLNNHRMLHTGEKPHVCNVCSKAFTQKIALVSHMKVHR